MESKVKKITTVAVLCALAFVLTLFVRIPVVMFLKYEPKDIVLTLSGMIWDPFTAAIMSIALSIVEMITISDTGILGCIMNIISSVSFACVVSFIYKKKKNSSGLIVGLIFGCISMVSVMLLWNYLITPLYMGYPRSMVAKMLIPVFLPFNLLKAGLNASFTFLIYKPLFSVLRNRGMLEDDSNKENKKTYISYILLVSLILVTSVLCILSFNKII